MSHYFSARFGRRFSWLAVFALLIFSTIFVLSEAKALEYGGIGGRPAYPRADNPRTESIFIHTLTPGTSQEEGVLLVNNSADKKTLLVYGVDSIVSSGGAFACRQFSEAKEGVGAWLELEKAEVELNPGASELIPFNIKVPADASVGEHNGCIVIQEKKEEGGEQAGVNLSFRTGLRVAVSIPGDIVRELAIVSFSLERGKQGSIILTPELENRGNVSIDADVKIITKNIFGLEKVEQGGEFPILRDQSSTWNFEVKKPFWGGFYRSQLRVSYQQAPDTEIGKDSSAPLTVLEGETLTFFSAPQAWALVIEILVLLAIIALIFLFLISRKRRNWVRRSWREEEVEVSDIKSLADARRVSWKLLAKVNGLKAPYVLEKGRKLKLPPRS